LFTVKLHNSSEDNLYHDNCVIALSSRPWLSYIHQGQPALVPLA